MSWLIEKLGKIVIRKVDEAPFFDSSFSGLLEFPASFSVSSKTNVSRCITFESLLKYLDLVKSEVSIKTYKYFEEYMQAIIEQHVDAVPPATGSRDELKKEILVGMKRTWHLVSLSPCMFADHLDCKVHAI